MRLRASEKGTNRTVEFRRLCVLILFSSFVGYFVSIGENMSTLERIANKASSFLTEEEKDYTDRLIAANQKSNAAKTSGNEGRAAAIEMFKDLPKAVPPSRTVELSTGPLKEKGITPEALFVSYYHVPADATSLARLNNRVLFKIDFNLDGSEARVEQMIRAAKNLALRSKKGTPEKIASYLQAHLKKLAAEESIK